MENGRYRNTQSKPFWRFKLIGRRYRYRIKQSNAGKFPTSFTGAFPAEYNNALSGVFDIAMRTGNNQKRRTSVQLGFLGIDASSEGPFKKGGRSSYLFNYRYSTLALLAPLLPENAGGIKYQDLSLS